MTKTAISWFTTIKKSIFLICLLLAIFSSRAYADFHTSIMGGTYLNDPSKFVYDLSLFFNQKWGLRYTVMPEFVYSEDNTTTSNANSISHYTIEGDYKSPALVYLIDYQAFTSRQAVPFDFLTAYVAAGYAEQDLTITEHRSSASGNILVKSEHIHHTKTPVYSGAFGFYGGEKFMVIDTSLRYIRGTLDDKDVMDKPIEFEHWLISASIGFSY